MRAAVVVGVVVILLGSGWARPALAGDASESFRGLCTFTVRDQADPSSPPQGPVIPNRSFGTIIGSGLCSGSLTDARGTPRRLSNEPVGFAAEFVADGTCAVATLTSSGALEFRDGEIGFRLVEDFVGPVVTGRMTGRDGGDATVVREFLGPEAPGQAVDCLGGRTTVADFLLQLTTRSISG